MKKVILMLLAVMLCFTTTVSAYTNISDWAIAEYEKAEDAKLVPACLADSDLTKAITRAEFAALSVKLYEAFSGTSINVPANNPFTDTTDNEVLKANAAGIVNGMGDGLFAPNQTVTRAQAATMLARAFTESTGASVKPAGTAAKFADDAEFAGWDWAYSNIYYMAENGIIKGMDGNRFAPSANCTRDQSIAIAVRMYEKFKPVEVEDLSVNLPPIDFGTVTKKEVSEGYASIVLKNTTLENYRDFVKSCETFYPNSIYELDAGYTYSKTLNNEIYQVQITLDPAAGEMNINIQYKPY